MNDNPDFRGEFAFSYRPWHFHLVELFRRPVFLATSAITVFGVLWTVGEASIQLLEANPQGWHWYAYLVAISLVSALALRIFQYASTIPDGFEQVSRHAQKIAHWQRPLWEFRLAKSLLAEKIGHHDRELSALMNGRVFVNGHKPVTIKAYTDWSTSRIDNVRKMVDVAKVLLLNDFPASLQSTPTKSADPKAILYEIEKLSRFYGATVDFETEAHAILLPEEFEKLHRLQQGWAEPIRDGVHQLFLFLQQLCDADPRRAHNRIAFTIEFKEIAAINPYCDEMQRLQERLPELAADW